MGSCKPKKAMRLSARFAVLVIAVIVMASLGYLAWDGAAQQAALESKALSEARTLNAEMQAVWDYIDESQNAINYNSDGSYDFKGIYCSIAGKGIAQKFTRKSEGYVIRYVRENPRSGTDEPDAFEQQALERFAEQGATEQYGFSSFNGELTFRYVSVITARQNCLVCHGEPAGMPDETGFLKEGMQTGDIAGASSIVIPLDLYKSEASAATFRSLVFLLILTVAVVSIVRFALHRWVTEPLARANERLQTESEAKSSFLATMSHELRTPLSSIIAFTDIWKKLPRSKDPKEERLVEEIKENSIVLLDMVNNTIDVARIEAGRFELVYDEVDLVDVASAVLSVIEPLALKREIAVEKHLDPSLPIIYSDAEALRKITLNLMSNALKFTERGGTVILQIQVSFDGALLCIEVSDTGCGIDQEDFERIFDRFSQTGRSRGGSSTGSGLGLFLVKSLAEQLDGDVAVQSIKGKGSTFTVALPVQARDIEDVDRS